VTESDTEATRQFAIGQRWLSETEPELGLGIVQRLGNRQVVVVFPSCGDIRTYAASSAPLHRIQLARGDPLETAHGLTTTIRDVRCDANGLLTYVTDDGRIPEQQLADHVAVSGPLDRLLQGRVDECATFSLRLRARRRLQRLQMSDARGFAGGRMALIPHQLYVASEVARRTVPRVLLADEVGLGKTIEASLIAHRLLVSGQISRVLFLVPEALVHQWFVELLRRFNITPAIYDHERCNDTSPPQEESNPFLNEQIILCPMELLAERFDYAQQAAEAGWDLVVIDEAHHLAWSPEDISPEYIVAEGLSRRTRGLLLLTATPEEIGPENHFARLRLLDPDRYWELAEYLKESVRYQAFCPIAERLAEGIELTAHDQSLLTGLGISINAPPHDQLRALLDRYGPGRAVFRNTRRRMRNFPKRHAHLYPLSPGEKVTWLADFLRARNREKVLLICHTKRQVTRVAEELATCLNVKTALFHENLTLIQRDRNAAWFSEPDGAQILLASEIGGEGRNFQFAHHLILFDLPDNPEVLEQRIGRLDRIGQTHDIHIHVPFEEGTPDAVLAQWYHQALNALEEPLHGAHAIYERFRDRLRSAETLLGTPEWDALARESKASKEAMEDQLRHGQDRLLELQSWDSDVAGGLANTIQAADRDRDLEQAVLELCDHFGVHVDDAAPRTYTLHPEHLFTDAFPVLTSDGLTATFDREKALGREEIEFLTWDHPMVTGAIELLLSSHDGTAAMGFWPTDTRKMLLLEVIFVLEASEAQNGHAHRFLPATPIRVAVDHDGRDVTGELVGAGFEEQLKEGRKHPVLNRREATRELVPIMLDAAEKIAQRISAPALTEALERLHTETDTEVERLEALRRINGHVPRAETDEWRERAVEIATTIEKAQLRLDAVRLIWCGPEG
jgi:ATP-dependent helicase HepA